MSELTDEQKEKIAELSDPRVVDADEHDDLLENVEDLREEVSEKEARIEELSELSNNFDELAERTELLDEAGRENVESLSDYDDPVFMEQDEYEELQGQVDSIRSIFANRLADAMDLFTSDELEEKLTLGEMEEKMEEQFGEDYEEELTGGEPEGKDLTDEELEELEEREEVDEEEQLQEEEIQSEQERLAQTVFAD